MSKTFNYLAQLYRSLSNNVHSIELNDIDSIELNDIDSTRSNDSILIRTWLRENRLAFY